MRSEILTILIVVALCVYALATERPEPFSPGDILIVSSGEPDDPNGAVPPTGEVPNRTWDPAEHLRADWEYISASMASRLYNPAFRRSTSVEGPQWSLSMMSAVYLTDSNGLVGWSPVPSSVLALDPEGRVVTSTKVNSFMTRWYQQPSSRKAGVPSQNWLTLNLPIDPDAAYPDLFSRVEWTMNVLLADEVRIVDIPFQASKTWAELAPGIEVLVEQAAVAEGTYHYRFKVRYAPAEVDYVVGGYYLWRDNARPLAAVLRLDVLNAEGQSVRDLGGGAFSSSNSSGGSKDQITVTTSGNGTCKECGTVATLRYTLAFGMYEQEVRLAVENVPVPEF